MQDEINSKVVALSVRLGTASAKMTAHALRQAMQKYLAEKQRPKAKAVDHAKHGKQTVGQLMKKNTELTNIEITDQNIKSFERIAKKYKDITCPALLDQLLLLSDSDLALLNAYMFEGYSQDEIAKILKVSQQAVAKKLKRLKIFLKRFE